MAVAGERAIETFAPLGDHLIGVEPKSSLIEGWNAVDGAKQVGSEARAIGQIPICWDPDRDTAVKKAHEQFRWFGGGWPVNADLPTPAGFEGATQFVRPEDVADAIPCGPDLDAVVEAASAYWKAGFTDVAIVQIGDDGQDRFLAEAAGPLLEKLRAAAPAMPDDEPAVLLDIDGTLVDSTYHHAVAWHRAFSRVADDVPPLWRLHRSIGMGGDRLVSAVAGDEAEEKHGDDLRDAWRRSTRAPGRGAPARRAPRTWCADSSRDGFAVALARSGDPQFSREAVDLLGIG